MQSSDVRFWKTGEVGDTANAGAAQDASHHQELEQFVFHSHSSIWARLPHASHGKAKNTDETGSLLPIDRVGSAGCRNT
jgi:hypothetical protein